MFWINAINHDKPRFEWAVDEGQKMFTVFEVAPPWVLSQSRLGKGWFLIRVTGPMRAGTDAIGLYFAAALYGYFAAHFALHRFTYNV